MYERVIRYVREQPWAITPETLAVIGDVLRFRASGGRLTPDEVRERVGERRTRPAAERFFDPDSGEFYSPRWHDGDFQGYFGETSGQPLRARSVVAILGIYGIISQRVDLIDEMSGGGGAAIERIAPRFRSALADQAVKAIVFDIDSPGGGVYGVGEFADEIRAARGQKPIVAVANSLAASAAYWIASAAGELVATPGGELGSIGVYAAHVDLSRFLETVGEAWSLIHAGKYKVEGNPFEPLTDEARAAIQARVDDYYAAFVKAVAAGRDVTPAKVRGGFGQGRIVGAKDAKGEGMVDRVETFEETVTRVAGRRAASPAAMGEQLPGVAAAAHPEIAAALSRGRLLERP